LLAAIGALALAATLTGCGGSSPTGVAGAAVQPIEASKLPSTVLDLEVHQEDVKNTVAQAKNTYLEAASIFSLRRGNLVMATLQVSRLSDKFKATKTRQKAALADKIGGARSQPFRLGPDTVYLTKGIRQRISVWFRDKYLFVLSSRDDYDQQRGLLRQVLEIHP
jgi:outer membrane PBP1 activator LpoA protein